MSNIERKYAYYDEGVLPAEGEYGITYLTLYSSGSGNVYDGWIYDPEDKIPVSATERTFGFRNPDYPQYCWDDEVVVDLSNAQSREESSEFAQGRITSFNTNVSNRPIVLQDVDITGLTESEREAKATTVLFCAIPLVEDAYIQAEVEVQCKVNLSPDNTTGMVRIEAFYILNDESDRTMRPNPVHTFAVSTANERHTLPWLYWNPALKHDDHNYIGVKLICTGGTAEIGISDDPEYGDAMITLTSAGLTGDKIDPGKPVYIELFGLEEVPMNYHFKPSDYTVLCTYDTGEIYDVTNISAFSMEIGEKFVEPVTLLQATYCGLHASMNVRLGMIDYIEILGLDTFYDSYTLNIKDFTVLAYLQSGDIYDITAECTFSPAMGTTITVDTTLTATYVDDHSSTVLTFTDSMDITKIEEIMTRTGPRGGLIYTLYNDRCIRITGNANVTQEISGYKYHEVVQLPSDILSYFYGHPDYTGVLVWDAEGEIGGMSLPGPYISTISGFKDVVVKPQYVNHADSGNYNPITIYFKDNPYVTPYMLEFLLNIDYEVKELPNVPITIGNMSEAFAGCTSLQDIHFLKNVDFSNVTDVHDMFKGCTLLSDISGAKGWRFSQNCSDYSGMFRGCSALTSAREISLWNLSGASNLSGMFQYTGLKNLVGIGSWRNIGMDSSASSVNVKWMFAYSEIDDLIGLNDTFFSGKIKDLTEMFRNCTNLKNLQHGNASEGRVFDMSHVEIMNSMFSGCWNLEDISDSADWDVSNIRDMSYMFSGCPKLAHSSQIDYLTRWNPSSCEDFTYMFVRQPIIADGHAKIYWNDLTFTKEQLFALKNGLIRMKNLDPIIARELGLPDPQGIYMFSTGGMFAGYDILDIQGSSSEGWHIANTINQAFLPNFYMNVMAREILNNGFYLDPS